ncbi:hypothetical protein A9Q91_06050 [Candidatus Gracilibacteria bacterium 28_42_T64]|nr:hypothetical protein A9Q91_06050 [Candidatus Gracilibacteria bacterium 28_42_T64]
MAVRRHWIIFVMLGAIFVTGVIISIILFVILGVTFLSMMLNITFWLFFLLVLYIKWLNHELDLYIITNNRIIGVEQKSFLDRKVSETNLGQVQEVNSSTKGVFSNLLNYGTLFIQTAGSQQNLKMDFAPDSMQEARKILNIVDDYRDKQNAMMGKTQDPSDDIHN